MNRHGGKALFLLLEETLPHIQPVEEHRKQLSLAPLSLRKEHCWYLNQGSVGQHRATEKEEKQKISRNKSNIWKCRLTPPPIYLSYSKVRIIITTSCEKHVFIHRAPTVKLSLTYSCFKQTRECLQMFQLAVVWGHFTKNIQKTNCHQCFLEWELHFWKWLMKAIIKT